MYIWKRGSSAFDVYVYLCVCILDISDYTEMIMGMCESMKLVEKKPLDIVWWVAARKTRERRGQMPLQSANHTNIKIRYLGKHDVHTSSACVLTQDMHS